MGKVVNIEDYRNDTIDQIWARIDGIRKVMLTVIQDERSTVPDLEMVRRLYTLKDYLIDKAITYREHTVN